MIEQVTCPVSLMIFFDPVLILPSGVVLERNVFLKIAKDTNRCPLTRMEIYSYCSCKRTLGIVENLLQNNLIGKKDIGFPECSDDYLEYIFGSYTLKKALSMCYQSVDRVLYAIYSNSSTIKLSDNFFIDLYHLLKKECLPCDNLGEKLLRFMFISVENICVFKKRIWMKNLIEDIGPEIWIGHSSKLIVETKIFSRITPTLKEMKEYVSNIDDYTMHYYYRNKKNIFRQKKEVIDILIERFPYESLSNFFHVIVSTSKHQTINRCLIYIDFFIKNNLVDFDRYWSKTKTFNDCLHSKNYLFKHILSCDESPCLTKSEFKYYVESCHKNVEIEDQQEYVDEEEEFVNNRSSSMKQNTKLYRSSSKKSIKR